MKTAIKKVKPTPTNIGKFYGLTRQTIATYRDGSIELQRRYIALKEFFIKLHKEEEYQMSKWKKFTEVTNKLLKHQRDINQTIVGDSYALNEQVNRTERLIK